MFAKRCAAIVIDNGHKRGHNERIDCGLHEYYLLILHMYVSYSYHWNLKEGKSKNW